MTNMYYRQVADDLDKAADKLEHSLFTRVPFTVEDMREGAKAIRALIAERKQ